jgi:hypothetical protein
MFVFLLLVIAVVGKAEGASVLVRQRSTVQAWERHRIRQPCSGTDEIVNNAANVERRHVRRQHVEAVEPTENEPISSGNNGRVNEQLKQSIVMISRLLQRLNMAVEQFRNLYVSTDGHRDFMKQRKNSDNHFFC